MPARQKYLLIGLAAALVLWMGGGWIRQTVLGPIADLRGELKQAQERVDTKTEQALNIERAKKKLLEWQSQSLPPDARKKKIPDAAEAQRQYLEWLTGLAHDIGFEEVSVIPQQGRPMTLTQRTGIRAGNSVVCMEVVVQIDGLGRLSQLYELLDRIHSVNLLQRISQLKITSEDVLGDPPVKFSLSAAGLALTDAPPRRTLFTRTKLVEAVDSAAAKLTVSEIAGFPNKGPFRIRLDREHMEVSATNDRTWTVTRGIDRSEPAEHAAGSTVVFVPVLAENAPLAEAEFHERVRENPFVKPTPPIQYDMQFGPFAPAIAVRGKTFELSLAAREFDPARGEPAYRVLGESPKGLTVHAKTGKLSWKPDGKLPAGKYPVAVQVRHPSAPEGSLSQALELTLVEPNATPKIAPIAQQTLYQGQTWRIKIKATDSDEPEQRLTYKLGANPPSGCQINPLTGELNWTLSGDQPVGSTAIVVTVSDSGQPPQSATVTIAADVQEDTAKQTELIGIVTVDDVPEAWFYDKTKSKKTAMRIGDAVQVADIDATIAEIGADFILVRLGEVEHRLKLGANLRSLTAEPEAAAAGSENPPAADAAVATPAAGE